MAPIKTAALTTLTKGFMKIGYKGLLLLLAVYISRKIALCTRSDTTSSIVMRLCLQRMYKMFFPRTITKAGSHFAVKKEGVTGFQRTEGFTTFFSPVINVYEGKYTLFRLFGNYCVNLSYDVVRSDDDHVELSRPRLSIGDQAHNALEFVSGDVATLGYTSQGVNRVQVQAAPYVGCDLLLTEFEECKFRVGNKPNMGYLAFVSKDMEMQTVDIPRMSQALKEELRPIYYEPIVDPVTTGGDGDVLATPLEKELDVILNKVTPLGKILPAPHTSESIVYAVNASAETITYKDRIQKYVTHDFELDKEVSGYVNEFVQLLVPPQFEHSGAFEDIDAIEDSQRASQRLGFNQVKCLTRLLGIESDKTFQKNEVYPEFKAPRNIINPCHGKRVSTAMMVRPLAKFLKEGSLQGIYGFGDAEYLSSVFGRIESLSELDKFETDGTKMDATISGPMRALELKILKRFFSEDLHDLVEEIHAAQFDKDPRNKFGTNMKLGPSRRSGEGGTSIFNTIIMCFAFYIWLRSLGNSPKESWNKLGAYGGDDGLTPAWGSEESLVESAARIHLILKVKRTPLAAPYSFLGMTKFPGTELYVPDVARFCGKISFSHVKGVPVEEVLIRKCLPYVQMFPNVPLVGNLCRAVLRILNSKGYIFTNQKYEEICRSGKGYVMTMLEGTSLPSVDDELSLRLVEAWTCDMLNISLTTLRRVCDAYDNATDFDQFPCGYVEQSNFLLDCKYEMLFRDLYIQGPTEAKSEYLPTESTNGCTNSSDAKDEEKQATEREDAISHGSSDKSPEPIPIAKAKKTRKRVKKPKAKPDERRNKLPEIVISSA